MRRKNARILYFASAICFLIFALGIMLFYPASQLQLNKGTEALYRVASPMFWIGLLAGIVLQIIVRAKMRRRVRSSNSSSSERSKVMQVLFRTKLSMILLAVFAVGLIGTIVSLIISVYGSWHLFIFIFLAVLGISEYLIFNSRYFTYIMKRSDRSV